MAHLTDLSGGLFFCFKTTNTRVNTKLIQKVVHKYAD